MRSDFLDLSGKRFHRWLVVRYLDSNRGDACFLCRCDCGVEKSVSGNSLRSGKSKSCGCYSRQVNKDRRIIDMPGKWFSRSFVLWNTRALGGEYRYLCYCECGLIFETSGYLLRSGKTLSCGCLGRANVTKDSIIGSFLCNYRWGAKRRGLDFDISTSDFRRLVKSPCFYCATLPTPMETFLNRYSLAAKNRDEPFNGIDRLDNDKGYVSGNVVPCCITCNRAKGTMPYKDFLLWIHRLIRHNTTEVAL
jgi:hypothetical protein